MRVASLVPSTTEVVAALGLVLALGAVASLIIALRVGQSPRQNVSGR